MENGISYKATMNNKRMDEFFVVKQKQEEAKPEIKQEEAKEEKKEIKLPEIIVTVTEN